MEDFSDSNDYRKGPFRLTANSYHRDERDEHSKSFSSHHKNDRAYHSTADSLGEESAGNNASSMHDRNAYGCGRSVGSVGSQGSGDRSYNVASHRNNHFSHRPFPSAYLMNGETRFPTASSYAASEAGKSDVATVCSGSVIEDIEVSSVMSGGDNSQSWGVASNAHPSPPSSVKVAPAVASTGSARRTLQGRGVEFAVSLQQELMVSAVFPHNNLQHHLPIRWHASENEAALESNNMMGPPLSRALLLQHRQFGSFSRAESVKSFGSNAGSDVVAHVDTDDCGGSLIESVTDGHSVHSQEDNRGSLDDETDTTVIAVTMPSNNLKDEDDQQLPHPWLRNGDENASGRVSPGGTIYRGRGVRRYQGRYMHLPLKRFHQDAMAMNISDDRLQINHEYDSNFETVEPWDEEKQRSRSKSPPERRHFQPRKRSWSRSRSRSRSPNRSRSRSPKPARSDGHRKTLKNGDSAPRGNRKSGDRSYSRSGNKSNRDEQGSSQSPARYKHRR